MAKNTVEKYCNFMYKNTVKRCLNMFFLCIFYVFYVEKCNKKLFKNVVKKVFFVKKY